MSDSMNVNSSSGSYTLNTTTSNQSISANASDSNGSVSANTTIKDSSISFIASSGTPQYVGARAYVVQTDSGAIITLSDYEGTTTAVIKNGDAALPDDINKLLESKVDKETGKGLSTNDFTTEERTKLSELSPMTETEVESVLTTVFNEE